MSRRALWIGAALVVIAIVIAGALVLRHRAGAHSQPYAASHRSANGQNFEQIERGRYLTAAADCAGCHTVPGGPSFAGGRAIETPFGNLLGSNITPDPETGIGAWSDDAFDAALRQGRLPSGALLYPAMPYVYLTRLTREDVLAIRAYLDTIPPVRNKVASNQLPFPFNFRTMMHVWNALYFRRGAIGNDPGKSPEWNRGAYLVEGAAHCGACHTPKNLLGGDKTGDRFRGYSIQGWFAPDITRSRSLGLGDWSADDIETYLKSGHNRVAAATGPMAEVVRLSTAHMTDADRAAIAAYLKDQPAEPEAHGKAAPADDPAVTAGAAIYRDVCSACHAADGTGVAKLFPDLAHSANLRSEDPQTLIRVILRGARSVATEAEPTAPAMPAFGWQLDDEQVAAVLSYMRARWGAPSPIVEPDAVRKARRQLARRSE